MFERTQALRRARHRIKAMHAEDKSKRYTPFYRLFQDTRYIAEIGALDWAIQQAKDAEEQENERIIQPNSA